MRSWNNAKGSGTLLNFEFIDKENSQITATAFNDVAQRYNEIIKEGGVYIIKNAKVKLSNKRYTTIKNDYCLEFNEYTDLREVNDDSGENIKGSGFNFTNLE